LNRLNKFVAARFRDGNVAAFFTMFAVEILTGDASE